MTGFETGSLDSEPITQKGSSALDVDSTSHQNGTATRGGNYCCYLSANSTDGRIEPIFSPYHDWEEFIVEFAYRKTSGSTFAFIWRNGSTGVGQVNLGSLNNINHYTNGNGTTIANGALEDSSGTALYGNDSYVWVSVLVNIDASSGEITTYLDDVQQLQTTGDTTGNSETDVNAFAFTGDNNARIDDIVLRPRTILVDGATGGTPTLGGTLSGGGKTAEVYNYEDSSDDSALASGEYRLYLKDLSFGPELSATGWADNDTVTVTGLTGTLAVNAPNAHYVAGLEPGGQFLGTCYQELLLPTSDGNYTTGFTASGGGDRYADIDEIPADGVAYLESTAASDVVTFGLSNLANQSDIGSIIAVQPIAYSEKDGADPNALTMRLRHSSTDLDGAEQTVSSSYQALFDVMVNDPSGNQWTASNLDSTEAGFSSSTV
jgi:hypothetical protein